MIKTDMPDTTFTWEEVVVLRYILQNARDGARWPIAWSSPIVKRVIEKIGPIGLNSLVQDGN
jgi:hypothetical protein